MTTRDSGPDPRARAAAWRRRAAPVLLALLAVAPFVPLLAAGEIPAFRDHVTHFIPKRAILAAALEGRGSLTWNPFVTMGTPFLADPQSGVLYVPALACFGLLPLAAGYVAYLALHVALVGQGAWLLFRRLGRSRGAAFAGAAALQGGGIALSLLDVTNSLATLAWLPLAASAAHRAADERGLARPWRCGAGLLLAHALLAGEPTLAAGAAVFAVLVAGARHGVLARRLRLAPLALAARTAVTAAVMALWTLAFSLPQLLPLAALAAETRRGSGMPWELATLFSLAPVELFAFFAVQPFDLPAGRWSATQTFLPSTYLGWSVVGLALMARPRDLRRAWPFVLLAGVPTLLALGRHLPGYGLLFEHAGFDAFRYPVRFLVFTAVGVAGLAAVGADRALTRSAGPGRGLLRAALVGAAVALAFGLASLAWPEPLARHALRDLAASLPFLLGALAIAALARAGRASGATLAMALGVLVALDLARLDPEGRRGVPAAELLAPLEGLPPLAPGPGGCPPRVLCRVPLSLMLDHAGAGEPSPLEEARRHREFLEGPMAALEGAAEVGRDPVLPLERHEALDLALLRTQDAAELARFGIQAVVELARRDGHLFVWYRVIRADPSPLRLDGAGPSGTVRVVSWRAHDVRAEATLAEPARLVHLTSLVRGWRAEVDGAPAPLVPADGALMAVDLPAGRHDVRFAYAPWGLRAGALVAGAAALLAAATLALAGRLRGRAPRRRGP